jgi:hypothetical protein
MPWKATRSKRGVANHGAQSAAMKSHMITKHGCWFLVGWDASDEKQEVYGRVLQQKGQAGPRLDYCLEPESYSTQCGFATIDIWVDWLEDEGSNENKKVAIKSQFLRLQSNDSDTEESEPTPRKKTRKRKGSPISPTTIPIKKPKIKTEKPSITPSLQEATDELFDTKSPSISRFNIIAKAIFKDFFGYKKVPPPDVTRKIRDWKLLMGPKVSVLLCPWILRWLLETKQHPSQTNIAGPGDEKEDDIGPLMSLVLSFKEDNRILFVDEDYGEFRPTPLPLLPEITVQDTDTDTDGEVETTWDCIVRDLCYARDFASLSI